VSFIGMRLSAWYARAMQDRFQRLPVPPHCTPLRIRRLTTIGAAEASVQRPAVVQRAVGRPARFVPASEGDVPTLTW